jgi:hypothetical protein
MVIAALRRNDPAGWAILLLAAGGYAPQLSTHVFLGLIGLWILASPKAQLADIHSSYAGRIALSHVAIGASRPGM